MYGTAALGVTALGEQIGQARLVSTAALSAVTAAVSSTLALPEFFTIVFTAPSPSGGEVTAVTGSVCDSTDFESLASDLPASQWAVGRTIAADEAMSVLGHPLPWFEAGEEEIVGLWSPDQTIPVAVFDTDALFVHQVSWWLSTVDAHPLHDDLRSVGGAAAETVRDRYGHRHVPSGWQAVTDAGVPEVGWPTHSVSVAISAAVRVRDAGPADGLPAHLISYASRIADSHYVHIPLTGLPATFISAARAAPDGPIQFVDGADAAESLIVSLTDVGAVSTVPAVAEMPVTAVLQSKVGSAKLVLHVDNSLSVSRVSF